MKSQDESFADNNGGIDASGESSTISWAQGVAEASSNRAEGSPLAGGLLVADGAGSVSTSSFGQKIKAAVEADKAAAEAVAIAKAKSDELERYIATHAKKQQRQVARAASLGSESGMSMDSIAVQRLTKHKDGQGEEAFDNMLAKIQDPSDGVPNRTIVDNSSSNNEKVTIGEIFAKPSFDDQSVSSVSSVSINMDISNHLRGTKTGMDLLSSSGSDGLDPIRARNVLLLHLPFPVTLHTLLKDNPCPTAIRWNTKGTRIVLHSDHKDFDHILHSYFGDNTKFSNLRRKANRWSFQTKCIDKKSSKYHMWNERFLRDKDPVCLDICPTEAKRAGHKRAETLHQMPARSSTTGTDNKRSTSTGTTGTLPTLVTASTNDASSPSLSYQMSTREGPQGSRRPTPSNRKRKARPKMPIVMQEQSIAGSYLPRDSADLSEWLAEADI